MKLPEFRYADGLRKSQQIRFGGLNHNVGAMDGEIWDMENMTGEHAPVLATRRPRFKYKELQGGNGLYCWNELCWTDQTGFYYAGVKKGELTDGKKCFAAMGEYIIIFPDKKFYNTHEDKFGSLEASFEAKEINFENRKLFETETKGNVIKAAGIDFGTLFKAGDGVTISGCTLKTENNKAVIIRAVEGDSLIFYENTFKLDGENGDSPYTEKGNIKIERKAPELKFICENENRLWGCTENTIYASKLGDIFNWNVYDGLNTDSYAIDPGSAGEFTGCISYGGYPVFFKENHIYKVYGSMPSNFEVMGNASLGLAPGSESSLAIAGETLFYLSSSGVMAYAGGIPQPIGAAFGTERLCNAVGGSDGLRYYMCAQHENGDYRLHVYDTQRHVWHTEDKQRIVGFAMKQGDLYFMDSAGTIWINGNSQNVPPEAVQEERLGWWVEFADFTDESPNRKGIGKLQLRAELEDFAGFRVLISYDGGRWEEIYRTQMHQSRFELNHTSEKRTYYIPIIPRRADRCSIRLEGVGGCKIYGLTREIYKGSDFQYAERY